MKKTISYFGLLLTMAIGETSCTKNIDLKLNNATGQLVIEGNLTNVSGQQYIKLSQNVAFSAANTYPAVSGATVAISDSSGNTYPFTEGPGGTYSANGLAGLSGTRYTLTVITGDKTYTARSTMPVAVPLDSISAQNVGTRRGDHRRQIVVYFHDPAGVGNQYRFVEYVNGEQVSDFFVFNDRFTDGKEVSDILRENSTNINSGDTVTVEMQCIDEDMYTYWLTLKQEGGNKLGQQTVAPSNPPNNITPVALGYFNAHTTQSKTIVVR